MKILIKQISKMMPPIVLNVTERELFFRLGDNPFVRLSPPGPGAGPP